MGDPGGGSAGGRRGLGGEEQSVNIGGGGGGSGGGGSHNGDNESDCGRSLARYYSTHTTPSQYNQQQPLDTVSNTPGLLH